MKFYQAAIQCFQNAGDEELVKRCQAYEAADAAMVFRGESESKIAMAKDKTNTYLKKHERQAYLSEAKELQKDSDDMMRKAGYLFCEIDLNQHAAQCFYSCGDQEGAAELFLRLKKYGQSAECFHKMGELRKAAGLYAKAELFANAFECYERLEDWDGLIQCLN